MVAKALHAGQPQARQKTPAGIMEWTPPTLITASVGPRWKCIQPSTKQEESETKITTVGVDIAKSVFHVVGVNDRGKAVMKKQVRRKDLLAFVARLEPCRIALEACGGAHYWAREFQQHGHEVKLIAPQYVNPYVKGNKNDITMPRRSRRRRNVRPCVLCRSKTSSSRISRRCIGCVNGVSRSARLW